MKKNQQGFSLIELLIVVVIIGIIAAIAIPNLLASRRAANEASSVSSMRVFGSSQATWFSTTGNSADYGTADELFEASLIDCVLARATGATTTPAGVTCPATPGTPKSGYTFTSTPTAAAPPLPAAFLMTGNPSIPTGVTQTGARRFCMFEDGVLRGDAPVGGASAVFTRATCELAPPVN